MSDELLWLLKGKGDSEDFLQGILARKLFTKFKTKIQHLDDEDKDQLLAALILRNMDLPDDLEKVMSKYTEDMIEGILSREVMSVKKELQVPASAGEVGAKLVSRKRSEDGGTKKTKSKKSGKSAEVLRLSEL